MAKCEKCKTEFQEEGTHLCETKEAVALPDAVEDSKNPSALREQEESDGAQVENSAAESTVALHEERMKEAVIKHGKLLRNFILIAFVLNAIILIKRSFILPVELKDYTGILGGSVALVFVYFCIKNPRAKIPFYYKFVYVMQWIGILAILYFSKDIFSLLSVVGDLPDFYRAQLLLYLVASAISSVVGIGMIIRAIFSYHNLKEVEREMKEALSTISS